MILSWRENDGQGLMGTCADVLFFFFILLMCSIELTSWLEEFLIIPADARLEILVINRSPYAALL